MERIRIQFGVCQVRLEVAYSGRDVKLDMLIWMREVLGLEGDQVVVEAPERCKERSMKDVPREHSHLRTGERKRGHLGTHRAQSWERSRRRQ